MKKIPIYIIIITIFIFLFLLVFIASKSISSEDNTKSLTKNVSKDLVQKEYFFPINYFKNLDSLLFNTSYIGDDSLYVLAGDFDESSLSIWNEGKLVYNKICNGPQGFVFYKNKNLVSQGFYKIFDLYPEIKIKNNGIDLSSLSQTPENLLISINNYSNTKVYYYSEKSNPLKNKGFSNDSDLVIETKDILNENIIFKDFDFSEYGITKYIESLYKNTNYKLLKIKPERESNNWVYRLNPSKKYILCYVKNLYNLNFKFNDYEENISKNNSKGEIQLLEIEKGSSNIYIQNKDEKLTKHTINSEFIDAIYAPYYMYNQFLYGKEKTYIESKNRINYKICCFEI
jgi:hypothetical protein